MALSSRMCSCPSPSPCASSLRLTMPYLHVLSDRVLLFLNPRIQTVGCLVMPLLTGLAFIPGVGRGGAEQLEERRNNYHIHAIAIVCADSAAAAGLFYSRCPSLIGPVNFFDNSFHTLAISARSRSYRPTIVSIVLKYKIGLSFHGCLEAFLKTLLDFKSNRLVKKYKLHIFCFSAAHNIPIRILVENRSTFSPIKISPESLSFFQSLRASLVLVIRDS